MNDEWQWWALALGIVLGVAGYWLVRERLPRREEDVESAERGHEALWISRTVERDGAVAPPELVATILDLHREYLEERTPPPDWGVPLEPARQAAAEKPTDREVAEPTGTEPAAEEPPVVRRRSSAEMPPV